MPAALICTPAVLAKSPRLRACPASASRPSRGRRCLPRPPRRRGRCPCPQGSPAALLDRLVRGEQRVPGAGQVLRVGVLHQVDHVVEPAALEVGRSEEAPVPRRRNMPASACEAPVVMSVTPTCRSASCSPRQRRGLGEEAWGLLSVIVTTPSRRSCRRCAARPGARPSRASPRPRRSRSWPGSPRTAAASPRPRCRTRTSAPCTAMPIASIWRPRDCDREVRCSWTRWYWV